MALTKTLNITEEETWMLLRAVISRREDFTRPNEVGDDASVPREIYHHDIEICDNLINKLKPLL